MVFSHQCYLVAFYMKYSKSPQVSWTFLSILDDLNNAVVWMVLIFLNSNYFSPLSKLFETVPSAPTTTGITVRLIFHRFFLVLWRVQVPVSLFTFFYFYFGSARAAKSSKQQFFFFGKFAPSLIFCPILDDPFVSQSPREFYVPHSVGRILVCTYTIW